jgi:arylsulfatase A-like enzyme
MQEQTHRKEVAANRNGFARLLIVASLAALLILPASARSADAPAPGQRLPNILFFVSEDNDTFLGCYGDRQAHTPNLDELAADGILYANAFANAPVCAPARSTLITGVYASSLGTQNMRSLYRIPDSIRLFPQYLKEAGYYCTNPGKKTDYNFSPWPKETWDGNGDWTGRKPGQPFFCTFNAMTTHESCLHKTHVHPEFLAEKFTLPPYHPDTPEIRSNWVEYYHDVTKMDAEFGKVRERLEKEGLADDTIIFYFSDHGGILPRSKRFVYDSGLHVPLIVHFGKNFQHLAPVGPGSKVDAPVSFLDIAPSVLNLAGITVPSYMQGHPFLGPGATANQEYAFGFRNRMDEVYDMSRTVRNRRFRYIRNYMPHRIYGQHLEYLWQMPATVSWEKAFHEGKCNDAQSAFWRKKPVEELYDELNDPYEVNNLAEAKDYRQILDELRRVLRQHLLATRDTGFMPESDMVRRAESSTIRAIAQDDGSYPLEKIMAAAELASDPHEGDVPMLLALMKDADPAVRYWAATGCSVRKGISNREVRDALRHLMADPSPAVRVAAYEGLCRTGESSGGAWALIIELRHDTLLALNALDSLDPKIVKPHADRIAAELPDELTEDMMKKARWLLRKLGEPVPERIAEKKPKQ